ncbi:cupin-like domain-containing protein [Kordiimonas lacus]|uniref:Cupin-like domain-containing protein n=1 Tax=Kordiimonas lacus TaxID=637679 RepID=A0A1G6SXK0_9PROT|nr:cupin-like domain-containing protein [Kordiimonas lacus]SDD20917.1 Cupin-like domain-containing protein [Kordiimonas lacus]
MTDIKTRTRVLDGVNPDAIPFETLLDEGQPVILKGLAAKWPIVKQGEQGADAFTDQLKSFDAGRQVTGYVGTPDMKGRFFYNADMTCPNYDAVVTGLGDFLDQIQAEGAREGGRHCYMGSTDVDLFLPGFRDQNDLTLNHAMFEKSPMLVSVWIGNRTTAAAHYDMSNNLACNLIGRRRFTLFPPEQIHNLYPGPLEPTPGGQVVSMVDLEDPDYDRYPRFREALDSAQVADLGPGDALFFPALWWHQVEARDGFNAMMNYWWNDVPAFVDNPMDTLLHGLLSLRDRPAHEKAAWRHVFDYYVFGPAGTAAEHLPTHVRGELGPMDDFAARRLRAKVLRKLNR